MENLHWCIFPRLRGRVRSPWWFAQPIFLESGQTSRATISPRRIRWPVSRRSEWQHRQSTPSHWQLRKVGTSGQRPKPTHIEDYFLDQRLSQRTSLIISLTTLWRARGLGISLLTRFTLLMNGVPNSGLSMPLYSLLCLGYLNGLSWLGLLHH